MTDPINQGLDERLFQHIVESNLNAPYYRMIGIKTRALAPGRAEMAVMIDENRHTNPLGLVHGGMFASLADAAMGNAVRSLGIAGVTVECSVSFLGTVSAGVELVGRGQVVKSGRNILFVEAEVWSDRLVARANGVFFNTGPIEID